MALVKEYENVELGVMADTWIVQEVHYNRLSLTNFDMKVVVGVYQNKKAFKNKKKELGRFVEHFWVNNTNHSMSDIYAMLKEPTIMMQNTNLTGQGEPVMEEITRNKYFTDAVDLIEDNVV